MIKALSFTHKDPIVFVTSQWQRDPRPRKWFLAYKCVLLSYFMFCLLYFLVEGLRQDKPLRAHLKWFIMLTHWMILVCSTQSVMGAGLTFDSFLSHMNEHEDSKVHLGFCKAYWVMNVIATDMELVICLVYWTTLYDPKSNFPSVGNLMAHGAHYSVMLVELFMVAYPVKLGHVYSPLLFALGYLIFTIIYYFFGGSGVQDDPYIYSVINWNNYIKASSVALGCLFCIALSHCFHYGLYQLRKLLWKTIMKKREIIDY